MDDAESEVIKLKLKAESERLVERVKESIKYLEHFQGRYVPVSMTKGDNRFVTGEDWGKHVLTILKQALESNETES